MGTRIFVFRNKQRSQYNCKPEVNGYSRANTSKNYVDIQNVVVMVRWWGREICNPLSVILGLAKERVSVVQTLRASSQVA